MACGRQALDVENQARSVTGQRKPAITMALDALIKGMRDEQGNLLPKWSMIFVMSCVFAVSLDPLFFYILIIDQDNKCLQMDKKLRTIVLVLRSLTDTIFAVPFIYKIYNGVKVEMHKNLRTNVAANTTRNLFRESKREVLIEGGKKITQKMSWLSFSIINDFLALLPVPQLLILVAFYNMRGAGYVEHKKVLNIFLLGQYLPRIYRIHWSSNELRRTAGIWVKGLFNFFLYILASHILGAFWYFFSIERETSCWHNACAKHSPDPIGCTNTFYCGRRTTTSRNITFLNEHCPLDTPDGALPLSNFGIFLDSLKNHNSEHTKFGEKFFYSFWWGLRNLSNFGTNLTTTTNVWENLFAILISIIGLLLFLYLIGMYRQTLIQLEAEKSEEIRQKIEVKQLGVNQWIAENKFPDDIKKSINHSIEQALKKDKDADVQNPFLILPWKTKRSVKRHLLMDALRTVKKPKYMDEYMLTLMCEYLKSVTYIENTFVFRTGDPLDCMLFIIKGTMWTYTSSDSQVGQGISSMATKHLGKGHFYGEELLDWASDSFAKVPVSSKHVKTQTKVEAFVLMAKDLATVVSRCELARHTVRRFITKTQRRPPHSPAEIGGDKILPSTAGN
ncbi:cyclic nucleotide-gated ion channel 1-like [Pyrus communis]|uniref:cyclic nucleotide-gated ion channel 1-like n=1 Tax=Pyrus communis TaxID=23211 RepID=UPI0035BF0BA8